MQRTVAFLALILGFSSTWVVSAQDMGRITHVRAGGHPTYDRLVLQLDRSAEVVWGVERDPHAPVIEVAARPGRSKTYDTGLRRMGKFNIRPIPSGTRIRFDSKRRRIRVFTLTNPDRIVLDFADPGAQPFLAPKGTNVIEPQGLPSLSKPPTPSNQAPPAPTATRTAPVPEEPKAKAVPKVAKQAAPAPRTARRSPFEMPSRSQIKRAIEVKETQPKPASQAPSPPASPAAKPSASASAETQPTSSAAKKTSASGTPVAIWWGIGALALLALLTGGYMLRRATIEERTSLPPELRPGESMPPETISQEELFRSNTGVDLLDKRLDEEVRARMQLEERMANTNEELKVLRERLARLERRRGA